MKVSIGKHQGKNKGLWPRLGGGGDKTPRGNDPHNQGRWMGVLTGR